MDYDKIGLKVGIEIHQRLRTHKLFCHCASEGGGEPLDAFNRRLRASAGETGEVDPAALYEYTRGREFSYVPYRRTSCLVEMDEEPPHSMNEDALETVLQVVKALDCSVPDELQVMRKTVVDGSNTTGFQRTAVVGMDGDIVTPFGSVGIESVAVEEESAQILEREDGTAKYGLDRLGIPLIEIGTAPDVRTPEQARQLAETLGGLLRSTGRVQRGIGTIRQDVNVSIEGGARVEVKGFQELNGMEELVKREAERQKSLLQLKRILNDCEAAVGELREVTDTFTNTRSDIIESALDEGHSVHAFVLENFDGILNKKISGDRTFGRELADHAVAFGAGGMIHTDEKLGKYNLEEEFAELREELDASHDDVICVVAQKNETAEKACRAVMERAGQALEGVPEETRIPNQDLTTSYARPLPGGARMYPETDVPPIRISDELLDSIEEPTSLGARKRELEEKGVPEQMAEDLVGSERLYVFERADEEGEIDAKRVAEMLTATLTSLKRDGVDVSSISDDDLVKLSQDMADMPGEAVRTVIEKLADGEPYAQATDIDMLTEEELGEMVDEVLDENEELIEDEGMAAFKKLMGPLMGRVRGRIDGSLAAETLKAKLAERT